MMCGGGGDEEGGKLAGGIDFSTIQQLVVKTRKKLSLLLFFLPIS
jgi:hypothetical protein